MTRRLRAGVRRLIGVFTRTHRERDLAEELDSHLQLHIDDNLRTGMTPAEARRQALVALGGVEQTKERVRDARGTFVDSVQRDTVFALRYCHRRRWHVAAIVVMLAAGIGGSTAVFSFLYQVLLQPTGIVEPSRLVEVYQTTPPRDAARGISVFGGLPFAGMQQQRAENHALAKVAMTTDEYLGLVVGEQEARRVRAEFVSAGYFETLGVRLPMGHSFQPRDEVAGEPIAIISDRLWTSAFDSDEGMLGRNVRVNGRPCRIVGVAPEGFIGHALAERTDLWVPWGARAALGFDPADRGTAIARLKDGATLAQAASLTAAIGDRYVAGLPADERDGAGRHRVQPITMDRGALLDSLLPQPWLLLTGPFLMLLLACANVANLRLADIDVRQREFATRAALGASRSTILRQVLTEGLVPGVAACAVGLLLAYPCMTLLQRVPTQRMQESRLDVVLHPQAAAFAMALALLSVVLVGVVPAIRASRSNLADAIKAGTGARVAAGDVLMVLQVALALTLMTSGLLVVRSLDAARSQDLGLRPDNVVGMRLQFGTTGDARANAAMVQRLLDGARALPGVRVATVSAGFPLENAAASVIGTAEHHLLAPMIGTDYFATVGVEVLAGREFAAEDFTGAARVAIVNDAAARAGWPGEDPVGRTIGTHRIIGVVADHVFFSDVGMHEPLAFVRLPARDGTWPCLLVRTSGSPRATVSSLRQLARQVDPTAPILRIATLRDHLDGLHHHLRVASWLLGLCGLASLALAAMGVYSLLAYRVARQRKEIAVRMALGAARQAVVRMIVARLLRGMLLGVAAGGLGAFVLSRAFGGLFTGAAALDVEALAQTALVLLAVAVLASVVPSSRAVRLAPSATLRSE